MLCHDHDRTSRLKMSFLLTLPDLKSLKSVNTFLQSDLLSTVTLKLSDYACSVTFVCVKEFLCQILYV